MAGCPKMASGSAAFSGAMTEAQMAGRLESAELEAVQETKEQLKKLEGIKEDYEKLKTTLKKLPEELSHDIMVPMGKKAFMPGKLVHTNEILVLLGEEWFVETSASRASEIADRRLARLDEMIAQTDKQRQMFENRNNFTKDVAGVLRPDGDETEIREDYVAADFAAVQDKKRRRAAEAKPETRQQLMERARKAMAKCEAEQADEKEAGHQSDNSPSIKSQKPIGSDDNLKPVFKQQRQPSPLKERPHFRIAEMPITERDWDERLDREKNNRELEEIIVDDEDKNEVVSRLMKEEGKKIGVNDNDSDEDSDDDERYDQQRLTDDDDEDEEDDEEEDVPVVPFGNLGKPRPPPSEASDEVKEEEEDDDDEEEDVPIVAFGNLGETKSTSLSSSSSVVTPPNANRTISLTGSEDDEDTPRTRERKRLTWAAGVEDNDAAKCDAFGSRLKALFNSYKDEEIVVSDEEEEDEEAEDEKGGKSVTVEVDTVRIFVKHTRLEEAANTTSSCTDDIQVDERSPSSSSLRQTPRHPGEIKAAFSNATSTATTTSKTTFKEISETNRLGGESGSPLRATPPPSSGTPSTPAEPKSILKKKGRKVFSSAKFAALDDENNEDEEMANRANRTLKLDDVNGGESPEIAERKAIKRTDLVVAVTEEIKEREPVIYEDDLNLARSDNEPSKTSTIASSAESEVPPKRISKFKQQRQNRT